MVRIDEAELLKEMVSVYSPTGFTDRMRDLLLEKAKLLGLGGSVDRAGNVLITTGGGPTHIMFLCHMDTVPGELKVGFEGPFLTGRGSVDAKGCLATALMAAYTFRETESGLITIVAVPDEEGGSKGVLEILDGERPDMIIVGEPSGWEGITIAYKGALRLDYVHSTMKMHSGIRHENSIEMAIEFWGALEVFCVQESEGASGKGLFDVLSPTLTSMNTTDDGVALTTKMCIDIRIPPGYNIERLTSFFELNSMGANIEILGLELPVVMKKNNELVRSLIWAIRTQEGDPKFKKKTGTSDMNVVAHAWQDIPIVAYGPGDSSFDHSPEERIDIREFRKAIEILKQTVARILER